MSHFTLSLLTLSIKVGNNILLKTYSLSTKISFLVEHKKVIKNSGGVGFNGSGVLTEGTKLWGKKNYWWTFKWEKEPTPSITIDLGWEKIVTGFYLRNLYYGYVKMRGKNCSHI